MLKGADYDPGDAFRKPPITPKNHLKAAYNMDIFELSFHLFRGGHPEKTD